MTPFRSAPFRNGSQRSQRGVVLFIALIAMVVLSLAGVGLMRTVDTGTAVVGNLTFRQASIAPVNFAIEKSVDVIFKSKSIANLNAHDPGHRYFATLQPGEKPNGVPAVLAGSYPPAAYPPAFGVDTEVTTGIEVRSVIERVCADGPLPMIPSIANCDLMPPKVSAAGTDNEIKRIPIPPIPHYRVTIRVDWPNTNTVSYAQTFLR